MLEKVATKHPLADEPYMGSAQLQYFREKLTVWRDEILQGSDAMLSNLRDEETRIPDIAEWASNETERNYQLRAKDRERKLLSKINSALRRIEDGTYGYCEETLEPIGLQRLEARPVATLCIDAQERHERRERVYRDD